MRERKLNSTIQCVSDVLFINEKYCITAQSNTNRLLMWQFGDDDEQDDNGSIVVHSFHPIVCSNRASGIERLAFDGSSQLVALSNNSEHNLTLFSFISNQMPTKFSEIL